MDYIEKEVNGLKCLIRPNQYQGADWHMIEEVQHYWTPEEELKVVVDIGAAIGAFTRWIKHKYPNCKVIAVEPEEGNFKLLMENTKDLQGVTLYNAPLIYSDLPLYMQVDNINSGGHIVTTKKTDFEMPKAITLENIMEGGLKVDYLKMDCEGAEMNVLMTCDEESLKNVHLVVGERHFTQEDFLPIVHRLSSLGFYVFDEKHPELSVPPWNMLDRGLFKAINSHWKGE